MTEPSKQVWLLTSLGTSGAKPTRYIHNGQEEKFNFAPQAVMSLSLPKVTNVLLICSSEVKPESRSDVQATARNLGCEVEEVQIPLGLNALEQAEIFELIAGKLPVGCSVVLDITQGPRPLPFFFHVLALYLEKMKGVRIVGAWYCPVEIKDIPEPKPLVDLTSILKLGDWTIGVRELIDKMDFSGFRLLVPDFTNNVEVDQDPQIVSLQQQLATAELKSIELDKRIRNTDPDQRAELISEKNLNRNQIVHFKNLLDQSRVDLCNPSEKRSATKKQILDASQLHLSGLTLDAACRLVESPLCREDILALIPEEIPLRKELAGQVFDGIKHLIGNLKIGVKKKIILTPDWLMCQWDVINKFQEMGLHSLHIAAVREWAISYVLLKHWPNNASCNWLDYNYRKPAEDCLNDLRSRKCKIENDKHWKLFWVKVADSRNAIQHMGMKPNKLQPSDFVLDPDSSKFWESLRNCTVDAPSLPGGQHGTLLVVPIGMSPGVLFTALKKVNPKVLLLIGSDESLSLSADSIKKAEWLGRVEKHVVLDPYAGVDELKLLRDNATIKNLVCNASELVGVLTGGTTLLGLMVERVLSLGSRLLPSRQIFLVDRRPITDQKLDPYQEGEIYDIDYRPKIEINADRRI